MQSILQPTPFNNNSQLENSDQNHLNNKITADTSYENLAPNGTENQINTYKTITKTEGYNFFGLSRANTTDTCPGTTASVTVADIQP